MPFQYTFSDQKIDMENVLEYDYGYFKKEILNMTEIDLNQYKEKQMKRRIDTLIARNGLKSYKDYIDLIKRDNEKYRFFLSYITINVTEFFRTPEHWTDFEINIIPEIIKKSDGKPKIWSTACASGEEAYSLAMSFGKYIPLEDIKILATDLDTASLCKAETGVYNIKETEGVPEDLKKKYFIRSGSEFVVKNKLRKCIEFRKFNLLNDEFPEECDLIVCRNVLIYFTQETKDRLFMQFRNSLKDGGYLFTGNTEQIIYYKQMGFAKETSFAYQKTDDMKKARGIL